MKLKSKVSLLTFLSGAFVLFSILYIHEYVSHKAYIVESQQNLLSLSKEIAFHLDNLLTEKIKKAQTLASSPLLVNALLEDNARFSSLSTAERDKKIADLNKKWMASTPESHFVQNYLQNKTADFLKKQQEVLPGEYGEIFLTNKFGSIIATTGKLTTLAHAHKQWWRASYNDGLGKVFLDDRGFDESVAGYVLGVVVPVYSNNEIIGILKCNLNIKENLEQFVDNFSLVDQSGFLKIARSKGLVVMAKGQEPLSESLPEGLITYINESDEGALVLNHKSGKEHIVGHTVVKLTVGSNEVGFGGTQKTIDQSQGNLGESWHAVACIPQSQVMSNLHKTDKWQTLVGAISIICLASVAFLFGGLIVKPVSKLSEAAERISQGDLDGKVDILDDGEIGKAAKAFNHMTESLKSAEESRTKLMEQRMRSAQLEVLGTVAAGVAHEINNPIQGILNYATLIKQHASNEEKVNDLAVRVVKESDRIANITKNLLFYSRENYDTQSKVDVFELIRNAVSLIESKIRKAGIHLEISFPETSQEVTLYPQLFQQVILNLIDNSIDALKNKQFTNDIPEIKITGRVILQTFELEFEDNGEGVSDDILEKITKPFFTTKVSSEGTGLGLAIVNDIVDRHRGTLNIESIQGQYTKVKIRIPLSTDQIS